MRVLFSGRRKTGHWDLEAVEMAVRWAMHQAGAAALGELLQGEAPAAGQRSLPCSCGHQAHYRELRSKSVLTVVGRVDVSRPYYLCGHCHRGQFPADDELDIAPTQRSPLPPQRPLRGLLGDPSGLSSTFMSHTQPDPA